MISDHAAVETRDLTVTFSRWGQTFTALNKVNLSIPPGQWVMLVGHNGSGKSTFLKSIGGRLSTNAGKVWLGGNLISKMSPPEIAKHVFYVHQDPLMGTAPKLTLFENLLVADHKAHIEGTPKRELTRKYHALLEPLGLAGRMKQLAQYFSGGERQLIALLVARLRPTSLLLLDEPLAALDPAKAGICIDIITKLHQQGATIIQVTHEPVLAKSAGERTVALRDGEIVYDQSGSSREMHSMQNIWSSQVESNNNPPEMTGVK